MNSNLTTTATTNQCVAQIPAHVATSQMRVQGPPIGKPCPTLQFLHCRNSGSDSQKPRDYVVDHLSGLVVFFHTWKSDRKVKNTGKGGFWPQLLSLCKLW